MQDTVINLAEIIKKKYSLYAEAASSPKELVEEAKKEIILAYKYHISENAKDPVLQIVATQYDEPWSKKFVKLITELVSQIDELSPAEIFKTTNHLLGMISDYKSDPEKKVRNFIHDSVKITRQPDKEYRERIKSKFETAIKGLSGLLEKAARKLKAFSPGTPLAGGTVDPQRKELSKNQIRMFMYTPIAASYGLDNMDMMTKILEDLSLKQKLTTIINAIERGHCPADGPEMREAVAELAELAKQKFSTNTSFFEHDIEPESEQDPEELQRADLFRVKREQAAELASEEERKRLQSLIRKRDEEAHQNSIEKDRDRLIRSDGVLKLLNKLILKGTYENR
jgi:hypothetical protein